MGTARTSPLWHVYMVRCSDQSLYTGITTDVQRRVNEHNSSKRGARYTKSRRPVALVRCVTCADVSHAAHIEAKIKKWPKEKKEAWGHA